MTPWREKHAEYDTACPLCLEEFERDESVVTTKCNGINGNDHKKFYHLTCLQAQVSRGRGCPFNCRSMTINALEPFDPDPNTQVVKYTYYYKMNL